MNIFSLIFPINDYFSATLLLYILRKLYNTIMENKKNNLYLMGVVFVAILGGLLFGYDTAVISGAEQALQKHLGLNSFWHGITASSALIGCVIGSAVSGVFASRLGRRNSLRVAALLFFYFCRCKATS